MKKTHYETKILSRNRNSTESGRSMVEMLGVLAIVGVISIGGIAGYNYGMTRYRTNEVLDGANKRAYTVVTQKTLGIPLNLSEFKEYDATAGGTFKSDVTEWDNGEFGIKVEGVKKEVCENILRMIGDNTPLRALSKSEGESEQELQSGDCTDGDTNAFSFVYNVEMLSKGAKPSSPSGVSSTGGGSASSSTGEEEEPSCPDDRKYTFRNVEMCCPHDLSDSNTCANEDDGCDGYELGLDGHTCCDTDGSYQDANGNWIYDFSICGCPDNTYFYDGDCHNCAKGDCSEESQTFVAGAIGTWDELNSAPNHGCPEGYTWADKATAEANLSDILNGTKCANCTERTMWTSTVYDSSTAWFLYYSGLFHDGFRGYGNSALCVVGSAI